MATKTPKTTKPAKGGTPIPAKRAAAKTKPAPQAKRKTGRPSLYDDKLANAICAAIAESDVSLRDLCKKPGMPNRSTVNRWLASNEAFATKYAHAREEQGDVVVDAMRTIEDKTLAGKIAPQAARAVLDSKRWRAEKLAPKRYGPQLKITPGDGASLVVFKDLTGRKDA